MPDSTRLDSLRFPFTFTFRLGRRVRSGAEGCPGVRAGGCAETKGDRLKDDFPCPALASLWYKIRRTSLSGRGEKRDSPAGTSSAWRPRCPLPVAAARPYPSAEPSAIFILSTAGTRIVGRRAHRPRPAVIQARTEARRSPIGYRSSSDKIITRSILPKRKAVSRLPILGATPHLRAASG